MNEFCVIGDTLTTFIGHPTDGLTPACPPARPQVQFDSNAILGVAMACTDGTIVKGGIFNPVGVDSTTPAYPANRRLDLQVQLEPGVTQKEEVCPTGFDELRAHVDQDRVVGLSIG